MCFSSMLTDSRRSSEGFLQSINEPLFFSGPHFWHFLVTDGADVVSSPGVTECILVLGTVLLRKWTYTCKYVNIAHTWVRNRECDSDRRLCIPTFDNSRSCLQLFKYMSFTEKVKTLCLEWTLHWYQIEVNLCRRLWKHLPYFSLDSTPQ